MKTLIEKPEMKALLRTARRESSAVNTHEPSPPLGRPMWEEAPNGWVAGADFTNAFWSSQTPKSIAKSKIHRNLAMDF